MYRNKTELAKIFGYSRPSIHRYVEEMRLRTGVGKRYPEQAIMGKMINVYAFSDHLRTRKAFKPLRFDAAYEKEKLKREGLI